MKKLIEKIKNYFNAKDFDEYDNLPIDEQYYRLRIRALKNAEKSSRWAIFFVILGAIIISISLIIGGVNAMGELDSEVTASAQEETQATSTVYNNYEISLNSAPLHFLVPYANYQTLSPGVSTYFKENVLDYQYTYSVVEGGAEYVETMYFAYQVIDNLGNIYYEGIGQAGGVLNAYINSNGQYRYNANSIQGVTFSGTVANWYALSTGERVFYPLVTTNSSYPFKIYISSANAIDISTFKLRSCSLHDLKVYGADDSRIWANYNFVVGSSSSHRDLSIIDVQQTDSTAPSYPVKQDPDTIYDVGYNAGYSTGYSEGNTIGYNAGYSTGYSEGNTIGFDNGFNSGYEDGKIFGAANSNDYSFMSLVSAVFDAPLSIIIGDYNPETNLREGGLLNFDLLGVNIASFLLAIFTVCVIIGLVKLFIR